LNFRIFQPNALAERTKDFDNTLTPRLAILRKLGKWNVYSSVSKGFSPPTTEEVFPTGGVINLDLSPEEGINYDLGVRADIGRFYFDINSFFFTLDNTIVQRRTAGGGNFYINGGKTRQSGLESYLSYKLFRQSNFLNSGMLWLSHTWHYFRYKNFEQTVFDTNTFRFKTENYSGNALPGIPEHAISSGLDIEFKNGFLGNITYYFNDRIPVTDANTEYADAFHLLGAKLGYQIFIKNQWRLKLVAGADNLLDERYSLGNDINGFGGRYYNAASGRNYYTSLIVQWKK
jgi:iron complex outermembrane receptor protein